MEALEQARRTDQPQGRRKWRRFLLWWVLPLAIVLIVVLVVGVMFWANIQLKFSRPYRIALEQVQKDPQVIERLGEPVENATLLPTGSLDKGAGTAVVHFAVEGPNGEARVSARARRITGQWGLTTLDVEFGDGQRVSLDTSSAGGPEAAPKWSPQTKDDTGPKDEPKAAPDTGLDPDIQIEIPEIPKVPGQ